MARAAALLLSLLLGLAAGEDGSGGRCGGRPSCVAADAEAADEDISLLQRRNRGISELGASKNSKCPGSPGAFCTGNQCCPGTETSGGKTFPCPSAQDGWDECETGKDKPVFPVVHVQCPGSPSGVMCAGDQCCPGIAATNNKTFPCVTAKASFDGCEKGRKATVEALLSAFTREQKYSWLQGIGWKNNTYDQLPEFYVGNAGYNTKAPLEETLYQRYGVPALNMQDNGQGFRTTYPAMYPQVTSWPVTLTVASSWSEDGTKQWAKAIAEEFRAKGANVILGPGLNVNRVALGGRNAEYASGESGYLGARIAKAWVRGVQKKRVLTVMKHFVNNNQETNRDSVNVIVDNRTQFEVYYPPFQGAVDGDVASTMCSYNIVNGEQACGNTMTLVDQLRGQMGFEGWVMSDWWALHAFEAPAVTQEMPGDSSPSVKGEFYNEKNLNTLSDETIDGMVRPILRYMLKYGLMEPEGQVCQVRNGSNLDGCEYSLYNVTATTPENEKLNRKLATEGVMLLKNDDNVLPLKDFKGLKKVALLGSACNASQNYTSQTATWDEGSMYNIGGSGRVVAWQPVSIYAGLSAKLQENGIELVYDFSDDPRSSIELALAADVAFVCAYTWATEGRDRASLSVIQEDFVMATTGFHEEAPTVTLTVSPGAIVMPWHDRVKGIVNLFQAGSQTGNAFADVIWGDYNPSAKSPVTFPFSVNDTILPCYNDSVPCVYSEGLFSGFPHYEGMDVLFPFGHGLSYTTFTYSDFGVCKTKECGCVDAEVCLTAKLTNDGKYTGTEVAQLYMGFPEGLGEPSKLLRGFSRIEDLKPGATADLLFPLYERDLQIYSEESNGWITPGGKYKAYIGGSSRDPAFVEGAFEVK